METVRVLAVDPSLRNTGLAVVSYNNEIGIHSKEAFKVEHCQVISNAAKYTGTEAILNMLDMLSVESQKDCYCETVDTVLIESPAVLFTKSWSAGSIAPMAHISGGCVVLFGIEKSHLFRPNEWNRTRKKDVTHNNTVAFLGDPDLWHYEKRVKSEKYMEHILDAASMALWWIKATYDDGEGD